MATGFDKFLSKPLPTTVKPTEHGLRTIIRRWEISAEALRVANADTNAFPAYETPDEEYTSALLVEQSTGDGTAFGVKLMYWRVYQELPTDNETLVQLGENIAAYTDNGLKQVEQRFIARAGHTLTGTVGTTIGTSGEIDSLYLADNRFAERGKVSAVVVKRWLEPGILSRTISEQNSGSSGTGKLRTEVVEAFVNVPTSTITGSFLVVKRESNVEGFKTIQYTFAKGEGRTRIRKSPGPTNMPGTQEITITSLGTPAALATAVLLSEEDSEEDGFTRHVRSFLGGTITGLKTTWTDVVDVTVPGTVELITQAVDAGVLSGTVAIIDHRPPRRKSVAATVEVEITTTPPTNTDRAYDLGEISCSVSSTQGNSAFLGTDVFETASGNQRFSGKKYRGSISARISDFPGSYLLNPTPTATGSFSYVGGWENQSTSPNTILNFAQTSVIQNKLTGFGSTSPTGYSTTGILQRKVRPILTAFDGTVYWEVVTWRV